MQEISSGWKAAYKIVCWIERDQEERPRGSKPVGLKERLLRLVNVLVSVLCYVDIKLDKDHKFDI